VEPTAAPEDYETAEAPQLTEVRASLLSSVRDRCIECGVPLADDQRYCLECGERNGEPRVPLIARSERAPAAATPSAHPRRLRMTPNTGLIAGVGTLLLAMGVGVLIGRAGDAGTKVTAPQVITVPAASAASTASTAAAAPGAAATSSAAKKRKAKKPRGARTAAGNATVKGTTGKVKIPKPVVKVGETKGSGPGYDKKTGKFTGDFFGQ
jgi:hypothetical protein